MRLEDERLIMTPDPFDGRIVPLQIAARALPDRPVESAAAAGRALAAARRVILAGVACGPRGEA